VSRAGRDADIVIVTFHWGGELLPAPREYQMILARIAVDNGADLVIGHHPHTLQPLEWYGGALIAYSLGNFVFGSYSPEAGGGALLVFFVGGSPVMADLYPLDVNNLRREFRPRPLESSRWNLLGSSIVVAMVDSASAGHAGVEVHPEGFIRLHPPKL
jgi:poly-gamma-glutamate synthesis protein (capsule biosynthesis protein)